MKLYTNHDNTDSALIQKPNIYEDKEWQGKEFMINATVLAVENRTVKIAVSGKDLHEKINYLASKKVELMCNIWHENSWKIKNKMQAGDKIECILFFAKKRFLFKDFGILKN